MSINVLPIIDLQTGQVQFPLHGLWVSYFVTNPRRLAESLTRTVRTPSFDVSREELSVFIAVTGHNHGIPHVFSLAKFPAFTSLTKLNS
ncbi:hypothetical protein ACX5K5_02815 [Glutamicibacter bergerei]|uniref:Uncharacterized protein n=2 Tax=Glutamicibacter TaxID=1742989 RepID=A0ABV9MN32_9MICC|nr:MULTISPECIES: hypothetical protein [Glutamicibacter]PCC37514.1 hypothetical protein CIK74_00420 [Glutamicibacter sp. BW77]GGJ53162.1 hypothetical protein GCM10007173_09630 [Glutamicibacter ardleyensis]HBV08699.1 hypothetical protein [Micrococcaceae bacterium]